MPDTKKMALITGANKGIGFEIARQLGATGIIVLLARVIKREEVKRPGNCVLKASKLLSFSLMSLTRRRLMQRLPSLMQRMGSWTFL
jgi:NAD(P)-dependent dehydrogenase (short-subunit alcohol dehydrogenase family)